MFYHYFHLRCSSRFLNPTQNIYIIQFSVYLNKHNTYNIIINSNVYIYIYRI